MSTYMKRNKSLSFLFVISVLVIFILAGCGSSTTTGSTQDETAVKSTSAESTETEDVVEEVEEEVVAQGVTITDHAGRELTFDEKPVRIVSVVGADLEIVHALGGEIVGRPSVRGPVVPAELSEIEEVGNSHNIDFEKIVSLEPDLVIGHARLNMKDVATAESLGLNMMLTAMDGYEDILETIELYGQVLSLEDKATELVQSMEERKAAIEPIKNEVKALVVFGSTESMMAALPTSLAGNLIEQVGITNIASDLPGIEKYPTYAQLSMEHVLQQNPDIVYIIAHGDAEAVKNKFEEEIKSNPAWENVKAMQNNNLVILPANLFSSNPGPRVVESLEFLSESIKSMN
ncbi:iron complex transport system substrate-binding protein [Bacillus mesophilus]|uniref:ABC transporter substrate-binding protein n=1 Tax=Bacillus mesophilus TaxID=1808955 RepID=A0A6M0Q8T4_9BACI|nr:ABC transporter substrate-binding protein [Bacillus mesophilus]MBM7661856.1 iron complex transport system substrate-binding protein [Bacillus mesophilus]NEY72781.1 ABC transporter substrate-binding protein [Bacillus mesophilus]